MTMVGQFPRLKNSALSPIPIAIVLFAVGQVLGCQKTIPPHATIPAHSAHPPALSAPVLPKLESIVPLTFSANLSALQTQIAAAFPQTIDDPDLDAGDGKHFRYTFKLSKFGAITTPLGKVRLPARPNPKVELANGRITVTAQYNGDIETKFFPGCHLNPVFPAVHISFRPGIVQNGTNFNLGMQDVQAYLDLAPQSDTDCGTGGFENLFVNVKGKILAALNNPAIIGQIKQKIQAAHRDIQSSQLDGPFCMTVQDGPQACLYPNPVALWASDLTGTFENASISLGFRGFPTIMLGDSPPAATAAPIILTPGAPPPTTQLRVYFPVVAPYAVINSELAKHVKSQAFTAGGMSFTASNIQATDASGRVLVSVDVTGEINGTVYLWGTPNLRAGGTILDVPDLQMSVESKTLLDRIKVGLAELVFGDLAEKVRPALTLDLNDSITKARAALSKEYKIGVVDLKLNLVPQLGPDAQPVYSRPDSIVANIMFQGAVQGSISN